MTESYSQGSKWIDGVRVTDVLREAYPSESRPGHTYETVLWADLSTSCNCRGWVHHKHCGHCCTIKENVRLRVNSISLRDLFYTFVRMTAAFHRRPITPAEVAAAERLAEERDPEFWRWVSSPPPPGRLRVTPGARIRFYPPPRRRPTHQHIWDEERDKGDNEEDTGRLPRPPVLPPKTPPVKRRIEL